MTPVQQGLVISLAGVTITFLALGGLIGVIYLLEWIFRVMPDEEEGKPPSEIEAPILKHNRAVAIAAAAWYLQQKKARHLGKRLLEPRGEWWKAIDEK